MRQYVVPFLLVTCTAPPRAAARDAAKLREASLEELMNVEISSFARKEQKLSRTAGAVYVITADDIRRSGATVLPEVLRMAPGLMVARIDSTKWAISARGFANRLANKMLVMIDGRSIYNNIYGGVFWDQHDLPLEEVERIEVIRGPGATSWGANAVNGIIHVITRKAADTQGMRVSLVSGGEERALASVRWGGRLGKSIHYRLTAKGHELDGLRPYPGGRVNNDWDAGRLGLRIDGRAGEREEWTVLADGYGMTAEQTIPVQTQARVTDQWRIASLSASGGSGLFRWRHAGDRVDTTVQAYVTSEVRNESLADARIRQTDFDFQQRYRWRKRQDLVWGLGYRHSSDRIYAGRASFTPDHQHDHLASSFVQDEISLVPDRLVFTAGSKFMHNNYTGFEVQPGVRLLWTPGDRTSVWSSVTRAVRTPTRFDRGLRTEFNLPEYRATGVLAGSPSTRSESVAAYEAGVRRQLGRQVHLDVAAFANDYGNLLNAPISEIGFGARGLQVTAVYQNVLRSRTQGVETSLQWEVNPKLRVNLGHSFFRDQHRFSREVLVIPGGGDPAGRNPRHMFQAHVAADLGPRMQADLFVYSVARVPRYDTAAYARVDARWSWRARPDLELSAGVRNAFQPAHVESQSEDFVRSANRRTAYVRLEWTWGRR